MPPSLSLSLLLSLLFSSLSLPLSSLPRGKITAQTPQGMRRADRSIVFDMIETADLLALGDCHRKCSIAKDVSKRGALTFKTKTLAALRAVAGDECEVKEATSCCEPTNGNDRRDLAGPLVIKYIACVYLCKGPWPVVGCCRGGGKSKQPQTRPTSEFLDFP